MAIRGLNGKGLMTRWLHIFLVSIPGFFFNFQPSEPYLIRYLLEVKNLTHADLDLRVWPTETYSSLAFALPVGILAEMIGFFPLVVLGMCFREATRIILIFGEGVEMMMIMQGTYAAGHAVLTVYYCLPYLLLLKEDFALATALQHAFYHLGNLMGSGLAQGLIMGKITSLKTLFYISWACTTTGLVALLVLRFVVRGPNSSLPYRTLWSEIRDVGFVRTFKETAMIFGNATIFSSCLGLVLAGSCWNVLGNYFQENLREHGLPKANYGFVELGLEACFVIGALPAILLSQKWHLKSFPLSALASACFGAPLVALSFLPFNWPIALFLNLVAFLGYAVVTSLQNTLIAQALPSRWAIVFSCKFLKFFIFGLTRHWQCTTCCRLQLRSRYSKLEWILIMKLAMAITK